MKKVFALTVCMFVATVLLFALPSEAPAEKYCDTDFGIIVRLNDGSLEYRFNNGNSMPVTQTQANHMCNEK